MKFLPCNVSSKPIHQDISPKGVIFYILKGKFLQTKMWIGKVESNFRNPTVKVEQIWIICLKVSNLHSFV